MNNEELLDYTQSVRKDLVNKLINTDEFYVDFKLQSSVLTALKDIDSNILNQKRLKLDSSKIDSDKLVNQALVEFTNKYGDKNPFMSNNVNKELKDVELPDIKTVPGQTDVGITNIDFNTIINQFES